MNHLAAIPRSRGAKLAFGEYANPVYHFDKAEVIVSLDADFLTSGPGAVRYARDFSDKRRVTGSDSTMNRLYVAESTTTVTGAMADHRAPVRSADIETFARALAAGLEIKGGGGATSSVSWISALVRDLQNHRGTSLVIAGDQQPPAVHALAHAINDALGNVGKTVHYTEPVEASPANSLESLKELVSDIQAGQVETLLILGVNPVYDAPPELQFAKNLLKVKLRIHLSLYNDETSELCHWHVPQAHYLESWGDARALRRHGDHNPAAHLAPYITANPRMKFSPSWMGMLARRITKWSGDIGSGRRRARTLRISGRPR